MLDSGCSGPWRFGIGPYACTARTGWIRYRPAGHRCSFGTAHASALTSLTTRFISENGFSGRLLFPFSLSCTQRLSVASLQFLGPLRRYVAVPRNRLHRVLGILVTIGVASAAYVYYVSITYKVRQFIVPSTYSWDLDIKYTDSNGESYTWGPTTIGTYTTWAENQDPTVTLLNTGTLGGAFSSFTVTVIFKEGGTDGDVTVTVNLASPSTTADLRNLGEWQKISL